MQIIQAYADAFVSTPDLVEDERDAREWAEVVVEVGTARLDSPVDEGPDTCVDCGQVIVWVHDFALWAVGGDPWSRSAVRCEPALDLMHNAGSLPEGER